MDASFNVALRIISVGLALSFIVYSLLGGMVWMLIKRVGERIRQIWGSRNDSTDTDTNAAQSSGNNLWIWPLAGLMLGVLMSITLRPGRSNRRPVAYDPERVREQLTKAYNPLLMRMNELYLNAGNMDIEGLAQAYREIRTELYAQSHLLSRQVLAAAEQADACLGGPAANHLAERLRVLRRQIQADHYRLRQQLASNRTPNGNEDRRQA